MIDTDTKRIYDTAIARAASERELATRRAETAEVEVMALRATLTHIYFKYAKVLPVEAILEINDALAMSAERVNGE
jgi:hypothetical protein